MEPGRKVEGRRYKDIWTKDAHGGAYRKARQAARRGFRDLK